LKKSPAMKNVGAGAQFANAIFWVASALTLSGAQRLGRVCGALMNRLPGSYKRRAEVNLSLALPGAGGDYLRPSLEHVASLFLEMPYWHSSRHSARHIKAQSDVYDWSEIDALLAQGKGLILISPHVGNFELLGPVFAQRHPSTVMFRVPKMRWLRDWIEALRSRAQLRLVPADMQGVRALAKTLKAGETIGILPDQVPIEGEGVWASFFGQQAYTTTLVQRLQNITGAPVVVLCAYRLAQAKGFEIKHWVVDLPWSADPAAAATQMNHALEKAIRHAPEQYLWGYDRFREPKRRPISRRD
jgi:Kdo2-lipid IVA lauroyltransferase/acyltransferase